MLSKKDILYYKSLKNCTIRNQDKCFAAETPKLVKDLLEAGMKEKIIYVNKDSLPKWINTYPNKKYIEIGQSELERMSHLKQANEVAAIFEKPKPKLFKQTQLTLVLDRISNPGNMGTIIRTADWFGIKNIICTDDCVDAFNEKVIQSTMGSIARVNVYYNTANEIRDILSVKSTIYGTDMNGCDLKKIVKTDFDVVIIGSEADGIQQLKHLVLKNISIPSKEKTNKPESLNAAIATSIILYHFSL